MGLGRLLWLRPGGTGAGNVGYWTRFCFKTDEYYHSSTLEYLTPFILTPCIVQEFFS